ncbi:MAG TPA: GlsB/YeaQ/YmgE family stress response membrane protein [Phototrophicaceae bacterium]|nr:GlsB/YeaQ/YmgE family stress response membrane protein [Phototrophicaceae bacterium]
MTIQVGQLIVWLITGALAGYLAGLLVRRRGFGTVGNIVIGLLGALVGGLIFQLLNIRISGLPTFTFSLADLLVAIIGAIVLMLIIGAVRRR